MKDIKCFADEDLAHSSACEDKYAPCYVCNKVIDVLNALTVKRQPYCATCFNEWQEENKADNPRA